MGKIIEKVLEILQKQAEETADILDIMFSDRATSYKKARKSIWRGGAQSFKTDWADWYRQRQSFYSLLNKLKREGIISKKTQSKYSPWYLTKQGKLILNRIKNGNQKKSVRISQTLKIITFDIPERERKKRDRLRRELISLGFDKLQKSVWVGKIEIPEHFIRELRKSDLLSCVQIFSVGKGGTLVEEGKTN